MKPKIIFKNIWQDRWSYILAILFGILSITQARFTKGTIQSSAINGSIMCLNMMLLSWQMIMTQGRWFWVCIAGSLGQIFQVGMAVFAFGNHGAIPGFVISAFVLVYQLIIYRYLRNQANDRQKLKEIAITDKLTGLLNRYGFEEEISKLIAKETPFYLFFLDLDNFKYVNDTLGHDAGDEVLRKVAGIWSSVPSYKYQTLTRLGGDEFALIVKTDKKNITDNVAKEVLKIEETNDPLLKNVSVSVGIVNYPKDAKDRKTLLSYADSAMYKAKNSGRNNAQYFDKSIHSELVQEYETKLKIANAIRNKQFEMLYQPQFNSDDTVYGFEALIRLNVDGQNIPTQYFIDVAEKNGLILGIDEFVLDKVTKDWSKIVRTSGKNLMMSVNISGKHLIAPGFVEEVVTILTRNNYPPQNLCIEITEGAFVKSVVLAKEVVDKLRLIGIKIALDDFGTKYSSLRYLQDFATNHLKIEKSFTDTIKIDSSESSIVNIIINIAHSLNCEVIAEGVETEDQLKYLRDHGCDIIQGYYYSKPLPFENAITCI